MQKTKSIDNDAPTALAFLMNAERSTRAAAWQGHMAQASHKSDVVAALLTIMKLAQPALGDSMGRVYDGLTDALCDAVDENGIEGGGMHDNFDDVIALIAAASDGSVAPAHQIAAE